MITTRLPSMTLNRRAPMGGALPIGSAKAYGAAMHPQPMPSLPGQYQQVQAPSAMMPLPSVGGGTMSDPIHARRMQIANAQNAIERKQSADYVRSLPVGASTVTATGGTTSIAPKPPESYAKPVVAAPVAPAAPMLPSTPSIAAPAASIMGQAPMQAVGGDRSGVYQGMQDRNAQIVGDANGAVANAQRENISEPGAYSGMDNTTLNTMLKAAMTTGNVAQQRAIRDEYASRQPKKPGELPAFEMTPEIAEKYSNLPQYVSTSGAVQANRTAYANAQENRANTLNGTAMLPGHFQNQKMQDEESARRTKVVDAGVGESGSRAGLNNAQAQHLGMQDKEIEAILPGLPKEQQARIRALNNQTVETAKQNEGLKKQIKDWQTKHDALVKQLATLNGKGNRKSDIADQAEAMERGDTPAAGPNPATPPQDLQKLVAPGGTLNGDGSMNLNGQRYVRGVVKGQTGWIKG